MLSFRETFLTRNVISEITPEIIQKLRTDFKYLCSYSTDGPWKVCKCIPFLDSVLWVGQQRFVESDEMKFIVVRIREATEFSLDVYDVEGNNCSIVASKVYHSRSVWSKLIGAWAPSYMASCCGFAEGWVYHTSVRDSMLICGHDIMQKRLIAILRRWLDKDTAGMIVTMATQ